MRAAFKRLCRLQTAGGELVKESLESQSGSLLKTLRLKYATTYKEQGRVNLNDTRNVHKADLISFVVSM